MKGTHGFWHINGLFPAFGISHMSKHGVGMGKIDVVGIADKD